MLKDIGDKIARADDLIGEALGETVEKQVDTQEEELKKKALMAAIQTIQKRAKRKYKKADDPGRQKYFLGERIDTSRSLLESSTRAMLKMLATDTLPGGKPTDIPNLNMALADYLTVQTAQSQDKVDVRTAHNALDALVKVIADGRRDVDRLHRLRHDLVEITIHRRSRFYSVHDLVIGHGGVGASSPRAVDPGGAAFTAQVV